MPDVVICPAIRNDLPRLTEIYNYYVLNTPITFDIEPYTVERRVAWFEQFGSGRHPSQAIRKTPTCHPSKPGMVVHLLPSC